MTARWGVQADALSRSLILPVEVLARPKPIGETNGEGGIGVHLVTSAHESTTNMEAFTPTSYCVAGEQIRISNSVNGDKVWLNGVLQPGNVSRMTCPPEGESIEVLALRVDGGGKQVTVLSLPRLEASFLNGVISCTAGQADGEWIEIRGGQQPYMVTAQLGAAMFSDTFPRAGLSSIEIQCPSRDISDGGARLRVVDGGGRSATNTGDVHARCDGAISAPTSLAVRAGTISSDSVTLSWSEVLCADDYEVNYTAVGESGSATTLELEDESVTIDGLAANRVYRFEVRARDGARLGDPSVAISVQTAPTPPMPEVRFDKWGEGGAYSVNITWAPVAGATSYADAIDVQPGVLGVPARSGAPQGVDCQTGNSAAERVCTGLLPSRVYEIAVEALNNNGAASDPGTAVACLGPCALEVSQVTTSGFKLSWTALDPGGF